MVSVIIIGAGAAGLAAAARLCEKGFDPAQITILEAQDRIGGRIHTVNYGGHVIEMGAQWVHGEENNVVFPLGEAAHEIQSDIFTLESTGLSENVAVSYCDGRKIEPEKFGEFKEIIEDIEEASKTELVHWHSSLGDFFEHKLEEYIKGGRLTSLDATTARDLMDWWHRFQNIEDGSDNWFDTCGVGSLQFVPCGGNQTQIWKRGYSVVFDIIMRNLPKTNNGQGLPLNDRICLNRAVQSVNWDRPDNKDQVRVNCNDGSVYEADVVLVTCSLGYLKYNADDMFVPSLPQKKKEAIRDMGFGTVDKIYLEFKDPWWSGTDWGGISFVNSQRNGRIESVSDWTENIIGFYTVRNQPNLLEGWLGGPSARYAENLSDSEIIEKCSQMLRKTMREDFSYVEPVGVIRTQWFNNPFFRGSYSYRPTKAKETDVWASDLADTVYDSQGNARVFFAGEATHSHYYSTAHAAVESGWREADRILTRTVRRVKANL